MRNYLGFIAVFASLLTSIDAQGLKPLRPSEFLSRSLRSEPSDQAPILREITNSDQITILRSQGEWYEIDVQSPEKLNFRGWLRGTLAAERLAPTPSPEVIAKKEDPRPLSSKSWVWFWDPNASRAGSVELHIGGQAALYTLKGNISGSNGTVYDYSFSGLSFGAAGDLPLLTTRLWNREFVWSLEGSYFYGLYSLSFGSDYEVPELRGVGYRVDTHTYRATSFGSLQLVDDADHPFNVGVGLGFYSHEVAPDLQALRSTYPGELVFVETSLQGLSIPIRLSGRFATDWIYSVTAAPILLASLSETGSQTPDLDASMFPYVATLRLGYQWTNSFASIAEFEQLSASGNASATGLTRLGTTYSNPEVDLSYLRGSLGFRFGF